MQYLPPDKIYLVRLLIMPFQDFIPAGGKKSGGETNSGFTDFVPAKKPGKQKIVETPKKTVEKPENKPEKKEEKKEKKD